MAKQNRWHPVILPDDYLRKLKQDLSESAAAAVSTTRREPEEGDADELRSDDATPP